MWLPMKLEDLNLKGSEKKKKKGNKTFPVYLNIIIIKKKNLVPRKIISFGALDFLIVHTEATEEVICQ